MMQLPWAMENTPLIRVTHARAMPPLRAHKHCPTCIWKMLLLGQMSGHHVCYGPSRTASLGMPCLRLFENTVQWGCPARCTGLLSALLLIFYLFCWLEPLADLFQSRTELGLPAPMMP